MTLAEKIHDALERHGVQDVSRELSRLLADLAAKHCSTAMKKGTRKQIKPVY